MPFSSETIRDQLSPLLFFPHGEVAEGCCCCSRNEKTETECPGASKEGKNTQGTRSSGRRELDSFGLLWLRLAHRIPGILRVWVVKMSMLSAMFFRCADGSALSKDQVSTLWTLRAPAGEGGSGRSKEDEKTLADEHPDMIPICSLHLSTNSRDRQDCTRLIVLGTEWNRPGINKLEQNIHLAFSIAGLCGLRALVNLLVINNLF